jgi:hypothetical protein
MKDIQSDENLAKDIIWWVQTRYRESEEYMGNKRKLFQYWYEKFTNPADSQTDKIKIHILFQQLKAFISTYYSEGMSVEFIGREFLDDDFAYMLEVCAKYDYEKMNKRQKDFFHIMNIWFYGVSILMKTWYDNINNTITYDVVSPNYWLPDPKGNVIDWFRYHMFDFQISQEEIDAINSQSTTWPVYVNVDKYSKTNIGKTEIEDRNKKARQINSSIINDVYQGTRVFMEYKGCKYVADFFSERGVIGRWEKIQPVTKEEKKNPSIIPFPVQVVNAFPLEDDPCGIGLAEMVLSFQNAKNRLMNLALKKEEWNAWFRVLLADISRIQDIDLLAERPTNGPIIIPYDGNLAPLTNNIVQPVMDGIQADQSTINLANILDQEAQISTWWTSQQRGMPFWPNISATEAKMQQVNSNIIFRIDSEVIGWWETGFWRDMWLRWLKEFLPANQKKFARIGNGLVSTDVEITKQDMDEHWEPDIIVQSKKAVRDSYKRKLDFMLAREAIVMQNPQVPAISKLFYQREIEKLMGTPREEIYLKYPRTPDEDRAMGYVAMINANVKPEALFYEGMDLYTYYIYLQKAKNNDLKAQILNKIKELMQESWLSAPEQPAGEMENAWQLANSMSNQMISNLVQQSWAVNNYPTRADILS